MTPFGQPGDDGRAAARPVRFTNMEKKDRASKKPTPRKGHLANREVAAQDELRVNAEATASAEATAQETSRHQESEQEQQDRDEHRVAGIPIYARVRTQRTIDRKRTGQRAIRIVVSISLLVVASIVGIAAWAAFFRNSTRSEGQSDARTATLQVPNVENVSTADADIIRMVNKWKNLFQTLAFHSELNHPPGVNAANGHFHRTVVEEAKNGEYYRLREKERPSSEETAKFSWEAKQLWGAFAVFYDDVIGSSEAAGPNSFRYQGNFESTKPAGQKALATPSIIVQILSAGASGNEETSTEQAAALAEHASAYQREFTDNELIRGAHMNGHIASGVRAAAVRVRHSLKTDILDRPGLNEGARRAAFVIDATMRAFEGLPADNHDPWLRGDWQVNFELICRAAGMRLHETEEEISGS